MLSLGAMAQRGDKPLSDSKKRQLADALMESGSYYNANDLYQELYEKNPKVGLAWNIAEAYYNSRDYPQALNWYKKVWDESPGAYPEAQYYYALCLKLNSRYDEAKTQFEDFRKKTKLRGPEATVYKRLARNESKGCDLAKLIMGEPIDMDIAAMGSRINAANTEFAPMPLGDDEFIYASLRSDSAINMGANKKSDMRSQFYRSERKGGVWAEGKLFDDMFNSMNGHVGNGSFSKDGDRFYFTVCNFDEDVSRPICEIYVSEQSKAGDWAKPKKVSNVNATGYTATHPTVGMSRGKEVLYFTSDREGGRGGMDIWYSVISGGGKEHARPRNCGPKLNTAGDEVTPFYNHKDELLYFSSNGQINIGGLDVFKAEGQERAWKTPLNVGFPVNSNVDDFYYVTTEDGEKGFVVSNREGAIALKNTFCCDDIFAFEYIFPPEFTIMTRVLSLESKEELDGANVTLLRASADTVGVDISKIANWSEFYIGTDFDNFTVNANKIDWLDGSATVSTKGLEESDTLYVDIYLDQIDTGYIELKNIYYALGSAELREESIEGLDSLYNILTTYPSIRIEVASHTDSRDTKPRNQDLSQRRAKSVVDYLVNERGIDPARLEPQGYGEEMLKNKCADGVPCTEEEHQINRRTEFKVLGQLENVIISYDQGRLDAFKGLERDLDGNLDDRIRELMETGQEDELEEFQEFEEQDQPEETGDVQQQIDNTISDATSQLEEVTEEVEASAAAALSDDLTREGQLWKGQAMVNGQQTTYTYRGNVPVVFVSKDFFMSLNAAGSVSEYKNAKPTALPDGSSAPGDIFFISTLQLGSTVIENVEAKIHPTNNDPVTLGKRLLDQNNCSIDIKKSRLKCK
jgi:outer membrane protein OmpA-like peptidoglycan-associated protein